MRKLMWWCTWSIDDEEFKNLLNKLEKLDKDVAIDLEKELNKLQKKDKGKENTGQATIESQQSGHTSRSNCYEPELDTQQSQQSVFDTHIGTQQSTTHEIQISNHEDPSLMPKVIYEELTLLAMRKTKIRPPTGGRRIKFTGVSTPTNLPYSPTKTI
ncbi:hypothetical protein HAX54_003201 [Datura stramonium]|uniref:Uncharacterized protein n=1 Tax=Datura stramonium TaxID=4076 RepID=A0ABS8T693_DATST|nr:hypothetical protein [Datura stramonium]